MKTARHAFSLIELLVVVTVIALLVAISIPSISGSLASIRMTSSTEVLVAALSTARQTAMARNMDVEVRLLRHGRTAGQSSDPAIRSVQLVAFGEGGSRPLERVRPLQTGIIVSSQPAQSSLANLTEVTALPADPSLPGFQRDYSYHAFRFRPDGSTNLKSLLPAQATYFLMLIEDRNHSGGGSLPDNFVTIQIEPLTGTPIVYRP